MPWLDRKGKKLDQDLVYPPLFLSWIRASEIQYVGRYEGGFGAVILTSLLRNPKNSTRVEK